MSDEKMNEYRKLFLSRLATLDHLLDIAEKHYQGDTGSLWNLRLSDDMLPFGTQVAYTCDQPHNFLLWCEGKATDHLDPDIQSMDQARQLIGHTRSRLMEAKLQDAKLAELKRIELRDGRYLELSGLDYVNEFLTPNFYFHLVTAYSLLRMAGVPLGKENYMMHLVPLVQQG